MDKEEIIRVLLLARVALEQSKPTMAHYPEPVQRHDDAIKAVKQLSDKLLQS